MKPVEPIHTVELFRPLSEALIHVLRNLKTPDWVRPTACPGWTVKDVTAHLLGGSLNRLQNPGESRGAAGPFTGSHTELIGLINQNNEAWVQASRRINSRLLILYLELADQGLANYFHGLAPNAKAPVAVTWAGEDRSPNWFDIAREYTEKWLHQQHIRQAVGAPLLVERRWLHPVLDTFLRGLPHVYRAVAAEPGTSVRIQIAGDAGDDWTLIRGRDGWALSIGRDEQATCLVRLDQDLAWRLFSKGVTKNTALAAVKFEGNQDLGQPVLDLVSIMA